MSAASVSHVWCHNGPYFDESRDGEHWVRHKVVKQTAHYVFIAQVGEDDDGTNYPLFTRKQPPYRVKTESLVRDGSACAGSECFYLEPVMHDSEVWRPTEWGFMHDQAATRERRRLEQEARERDSTYLAKCIDSIERELQQMADGVLIVTTGWERIQRAELARLRAKLQETEVLQ